MTWRMTAASLVGTPHLELASECQDAFRCLELPAVGRDALVVAIADGASGVARATEASALAVGVASAAIEELLAQTVPDLDDVRNWRRLMYLTLASTIQRVTDCFELLSCPQSVSLERLTGRSAALPSSSAVRTEHFATTLACVLLAPPIVVVGSIGSTCVVVRDSTGRSHLVTPPWGIGGDREHEVFLSSPRPLERAQVDYVWAPGLTGVLAATDGIGNAILELHGGLTFTREADVAALFAAADSGRPAALERHPLVVEARRGDDVTVVALTLARS
jgi:hypothetical protein